MEEEGGGKEEKQQRGAEMGRQIVLSPCKSFLMIRYLLSISPTNTFKTSKPHGIVSPHLLDQFESYRTDTQQVLIRKWMP